jgi:hypothetical protein
MAGVSDEQLVLTAASPSISKGREEKSTPKPQTPEKITTAFDN